MIAKRARKSSKAAKAAKLAAEDKTRFEPELPERSFSRGEQAWLNLARPEPAETDRWGAIEEHLLGQAVSKEHSLRRWKYFAR